MAALTRQAAVATRAKAAQDAPSSGALRLDGLQWGVGAWQSAAANLQVPAGQTLVLLGHNGAGKSALLDTLAGFLPARDGRVQLGGRDLTALPPEVRRIGYMFQRDALFPHWTIERNLRFGRGAQANLDTLLDALELRPWLRHYPQQLSGGQRQRVALARALVGSPDLLLLDEPLSAIDPEARPALRRILAALLRERAITTVLVTHDPGDARLLGDLVGVLDRGRLLQTAAPQQVFERPADLRTARLVGVDNLWPLQVLAPASGTPPNAILLGVDGQPVLNWHGTLPAGMEAQQGDRLILAVRAELIHPCPASTAPQGHPNPNDITLAARLIDARCEGPLWRLLCALPCGLAVDAFALPALWRELNLQTAEAVHLRVRQQDLHVLPASAE
ncbi:MAG: ABC transporter ATP-binding protein [Burkholderiaceae bacterium]|nr:ABC transporter ATP-binding protein [Burkholderiaceae bacterium]